MALRPPLRRRQRARRYDRRLPDEALGAFAGFIVASMAMRLLLAALSVEPWTVTWKVVNIATVAIVWPLARFGPLNATLVGSLQVAELLAMCAVLLVAAFLLATRTFRRRS